MAKYMYTAIRIADRFGLHFVLLTEHATAGWRVRDFEHCPADVLGPGICRELLRRRSSGRPIE